MVINRNSERTLLARDREAAKMSEESYQEVMTNLGSQFKLLRERNEKVVKDNNIKEATEPLPLFGGERGRDLNPYDGVEMQVQAWNFTISICDESGFPPTASPNLTPRWWFYKVLVKGISWREMSVSQLWWETYTVPDMELASGADYPNWTVSGDNNYYYSMKQSKKFGGSIINFTARPNLAHAGYSWETSKGGKISIPDLSCATIYRNKYRDAPAVENASVNSTGKQYGQGKNVGGNTGFFMEPTEKGMGRDAADVNGRGWSDILNETIYWSARYLNHKLYYINPPSETTGGGLGPYAIWADCGLRPGSLPHIPTGNRDRRACLAQWKGSPMYYGTWLNTLGVFNAGCQTDILGVNVPWINCGEGPRPISICDSTQNPCVFDKIGYDLDPGDIPYMVSSTAIGFMSPLTLLNMLSGAGTASNLEFWWLRVWKEFLKKLGHRDPPYDSASKSDPSAWLTVDADLFKTDRYLLFWKEESTGNNAIEIANYHNWGPWKDVWTSDIPKNP